jgi:hypothetical protein
MTSLIILGLLFYDINPMCYLCSKLGHSALRLSWMSVLVPFAPTMANLNLLTWSSGVQIVATLASTLHPIHLLILARWTVCIGLSLTKPMQCALDITCWRTNGTNLLRLLVT